MLHEEPDDMLYDFEMLHEEPDYMLYDFEMLHEEPDEMLFDFEMLHEEPDEMLFDIEMLHEEPDDMLFDFEEHLEELPKEPDYMPSNYKFFDFDENFLIQEIIKRFTIESLLTFLHVSKKWKSVIDNPEFIKNYHIDHPKPQHHLLVRHEVDTVETYTSIIDNKTFPQQKFSLTAPQFLSLLRDTETLNSVDGLLCFYGDEDVDSETQPSSMAVIWNPTIRKSVPIVIPIPTIPSVEYTVVGFGVCTGDLKLVRISVSEIFSRWEVDVFKLSTRVWRPLFKGEPFKLGHLGCAKVFANGCLYFRSHLDGLNIVFSFDLNNEIFGEVCLPDILVNTHYLDLHVAKVNESLGLLKHYDDDGTAVCEVWTRKDDGADKPFTKIHTISFEDKLFVVIGFRHNDDVVMELCDDENSEEHRIGVYETSSSNSKHIIDVGINGRRGTFSTRSYMETLFLLDQSEDIIH